MFGNFLTSLGEKLQGDANGQSADAVDDLFSSLTQPQQPKKNNAESGTVNAQEDPFAYLCSPDRTTTKPHVSKQKPSMTATETLAMMQSSSSNLMESLPLFSDQRANPSGVTSAAGLTTPQKTERQVEASKVNSMWAAGESDISSEEIEEQKTEEPAPSAPSKRDYLSSLVSKAGDFIKQELKTTINSKEQQITSADQDEVIRVLNQENEQLRDVLENQQQKVEDLQEEIEVHKSLEEDAHESNEELLYKVKYLEELARDNGKDISSLKRIEELGQEKKSLMQQVSGLERQMHLLENLKLSKDQSADSNDLDSEDDQNVREMFDNPKRALYDLKSLFELNRIQFNRQDEARVLTALYTQDKPVIRLYREIFFRQIAHKAIQSAESLFKQSNSTDRNGNEMCKLMIQNKRYSAQNETLSKQLNEQNVKVKQLEELLQMEKVKGKHKLNRVKSKAVALASETAQMQQCMSALKTQVRQTQESIDDEEMIDLSVQRFSSYLGYFMDQQSEQKERLNQQVDQLTQSTKTDRSKIEELELHNKETFVQLSQVQSEKVTLQEELGEAQETMNHLQQQCCNFDAEMIRLQEKQQQEQTASLQAQSVLQQEIQVLQLRPQGPISGGSLLTTASQDPQQDQQSTSPQAQQQISELEKMLEEREEEILELMEEVNKLQEREQQSPDVINTLAILKSKLKNSQQRFQEQASQPRSATSQSKTNLLKNAKKKPAGEQSSSQNDVKTVQQMPILIVDEGNDKSSQGSHLIEASPDPPRNQQTAESFNCNVRARLQEVQQQRLDEQIMDQQQQQQQQSPDVREPYSRIVKDGKDSNFFSSMVYENSAEKQQPQSKQKMDDLFGFLMDPVTQSKATPQENNSLGDNWSEAFGFPGLSQASSKQKLPEHLHSTQKEDKNHKKLLKEVGDNKGWGQDEEGIDLEEEICSNNEPMDSNNDKKAETVAVQIAMGYECSPSRKMQRGEIMLQESLENSPIKNNQNNRNDRNNAETEQSLHGNRNGDSQNDEKRMNDGNEMFESHGKKQSISHQQEQNQMYESPTLQKQQQSGENSECTLKKTDSHHKRSKELPATAGPLDGSMDYLRHIQADQDKDETDGEVDEFGQKISYRAAIESFAQDSDIPHGDMDSEIYDQLMEGEVSKSIESQSDSLLESSPFNNSFARQEVDMVVNAIRKNSLNSAENNGGHSPLYADEKKVNISNLSDLVSEDQLTDKLNSTDEDQYQKMMRPGELNEVEEVDEDISDDVMGSPRNKNNQILPESIHQRADSASILDMQRDKLSRKASEEYHQQLSSDGGSGYIEPPSMIESSKFDSMLVTEQDPDQINADSPDQKLKDCQENESPSKMELLIPQASDSQEKPRVTSARQNHRRSESIGENPFTSGGMTVTSQSPESEVTPQATYETLAEFTKENIIKYQEDGKTVSGTDGVDENNTCDFGNSQESQCEQISQEDDGDHPPEVTNVNGSAFFSRDFRVLKNANFGNRDQSDMILAKLQEEYGDIQQSKDSVTILAEMHEQNQQSFAEPPPPEPEVSACSIDPDQLKEGGFEMMGMNDMSQRSGGMMVMEGSFENNLRGSFERGSMIEDARMNSLLGSMIQGNQSITEQDFKLSLLRGGTEENSIEEYDEQNNTDDGIPEVDVYTESNRNSLADPSNQPEQSDFVPQQANTSQQEDDIDDQEQKHTLSDEIKVEPPTREEEDQKSLESVETISDNDISPAKFETQQSELLEDDENIIVQSNQQDSKEDILSNNQDEPTQNMAAAGWADDESLEDLDSPRQIEEMNRSVSGNEQVSDAVEASQLQSSPPTTVNDESGQEKLDSVADQMSQFLVGGGGASSRNQQQESRRDTPIPEHESMLLSGTNEQNVKESELKGWGDDSEDISLDDENSIVEEKSQQALQQSPDQINMSLTMQAEIGESDKFMCPNGHQLMMIDGKQHALPSQECSAYCGMANRVNSQNWLRCRECFYKVCYDCFHCASGHEMQTVKVEVIGGETESCSSCGNNLVGKLWMCQKRAQAIQSGDSSVGCTDNSLICQDCLGSGVSFVRKAQNSVDFVAGVDDLSPSPEQAEQAEQAEEVKSEVSAPHNEQIDILTETIKEIPEPNFEDMFAKVEQKLPNETLADPFSMLLGGQDITAAVQSNSQVELTNEQAQTEANTTEVGGTGGGWGDDEDDIDIDD